MELRSRVSPFSPRWTRCVLWACTLLLSSIEMAFHALPSEWSCRNPSIRCQTVPNLVRVVIWRIPHRPVVILLSHTVWRGYVGSSRSRCNCSSWPFPSKPRCICGFAQLGFGSEHLFQDWMEVGKSVWVASRGVGPRSRQGEDELKRVFGRRFPCVSPKLRYVGRRSWQKGVLIGRGKWFVLNALHSSFFTRQDPCWR